MALTQAFVTKELKAVNDRLEASLDRRLKKLAASPHSLKKTAWLVAGIIVGWDVLKWLVWNVIL